ncbi:anthocyanidin 5,3-O-glucosyltransferase-like [Triticum dicoccoides]|uniref:anthocyanidin 5,3-O-glucosyltransferase-like n=1 Tax=Triticum dicoccoides TaxID=85692 RepID=UPI0018909572|nr:anthocyanidin 5,3-O-glucosyltransferase-like [Triticum dicoccoides]
MEAIAYSNQAFRFNDMLQTGMTYDFISVGFNPTEMLDGHVCGVLVNTFEWLEARALRTLKDGSCIPAAMPPVYPVGPMVAGCGGGDREHECLAWLDGQPEKSVVFLCFGSRGCFPKKQLEEIAMGLERSGKRFLWVVSSSSEDQLQDLLPEGFLEKTDGRGFVIKSWAPQPEVLQHRATGAFLTHCGWNSALEGIVAGLPLICWPLYAEQRLNKVFIVEELMAGVEMAGYDGELVPAAEVESKVRLVMESPGGQALRERAMEAKERAARAAQQGGASDVAFAEFLAHLESVVRGH